MARPDAALGSAVGPATRAGAVLAVFGEFTKGGLVKGDLAIRHVFNYKCTRETRKLLNPHLLNPPL